MSERSGNNEASNAGADADETELLREKESLHEHLVQENKKLTSNLNACESNLSSFVSEMNQLLDQHDIGSLLGQALMPSDPDLVAVTSQRSRPPAQDSLNAHRQHQ